MEGRNNYQTPSDRSDGTGVLPWSEGCEWVCMMHEAAGSQNEGLVRPGKSAVE